ncbi:MAG: response regulator, partial [Actinomycetota bacterium]
VQLHGGRVVARSDGPGTGSEFEVWLPILERVEPESHDIAPADPDPAIETPGENSRERVVLVVDDNVDGALTMAEIIQTWGCETRVAHSGPDALNLAAEHQPTTVLLDIGMPGMDGYEVARRLRAREREASDAPGSSRMLIIALTGYGQDNDRQRAWEAGFDQHFTKPVDLDALRTLLTVEPSATR